MYIILLIQLKHEWSKLSYCQHWKLVRILLTELKHRSNEFSEYVYKIFNAISNVNFSMWRIQEKIRGFFRSKQLIPYVYSIFMDLWDTITCIENFNIFELLKNKLISKFVNFDFLLLMPQTSSQFLSFIFFYKWKILSLIKLTKNWTVLQEQIRKFVDIFVICRTTAPIRV